MQVIQLFIVLVIVGAVLWFVNRYIPMSGSIKAILNAVIVILVLLFVLSAFGVISPVAGLRIGG